MGHIPGMSGILEPPGGAAGVPGSGLLMFIPGIFIPGIVSKTNSCHTIQTTNSPASRYSTVA